MTPQNDLTKIYAASSRVRLARNIDGMPFPSEHDTFTSRQLIDFFSVARKAADGLFENDFYLMSSLSETQKAALVERNIISLPLANNNETGAVIIERGNERMSVMLNEEDRVREQCVTDGLSLLDAYARVNSYDDLLIGLTPVAYDEEFGFLTACPTNVGTGMRASVMLFLPALKLTGALESAMRSFILRYGLTIRGVYGEGSEALGDMYQISNSKTLGVSESEIINTVGRAATELCEAEGKALSYLQRGSRASLIDRIMRSASTLTGAYKLSFVELIKLVSDVKIGVILGIMPFAGLAPLDKLVCDCSVSAIKLTSGAVGEEADIRRAAAVKKLFREDLK